MSKFKNFLKHIFGLRTLKTAVATTLSIYIAELLGMNNPILAGISAVVSMTSSVFDSYKISVNRMISTIIGAAIAVLFQYFGIKSMIAMFFGIIFIINICNFFNWKKSISLSCIVFVVIMLYKPRSATDPNYLMYSFFRVTDTAIGLVIGFLINYFIAPPSRPNFLLNTYKKSLQEFENSFQLLLAGASNIKVENLIDDINEINTELKSIKNDKKLFMNREIKISDISTINYDFYSAFGLITQIADTENIPNVSQENLELFQKYFDDSLVVIPTCKDEEYYMAFNYYLTELLETFFKLRTNIANFEKNLGN
ncbi:FUSC family protein [Miniphocaeibacter halophilus]|uniref:FUSC family protein n=1 Tax=Miniphocaeibacter halophilus TaxID=2931922 RepID=A0AC61MTY6_9FIRM|nr:aromatic acid exporter family protein [Miniphocaeibacter halophilus]QQK08294.1 FUSC family protein [Miniphocaeibacter halophilus]